MADTTAEIGYGIVFARGNDDGPPETFTALGELIDITPPAEVVDDIEASHHGSPNAGKEYIPGMIEPGEISLTIAHVPGSTADTQINTDLRARQARNWQITYTDKEGNVIEDVFSGYVKSNTPTTPLSDRKTSEVVIKVVKLDPQRTITAP